MPLSKSFIDKSSADTLATSYEPRALEQGLKGRAFEYSNQERIAGDFKVDKVISEYIGIDQIERESQQKEVAKQALALAQEIQEKAYAEAYALGLEEGKEKAFLAEKEKIEKRLKVMEVILKEMKKFKTQFMRENESQIVSLCLYMAQRLLFKEVTESSTYIKDVLSKLLETIQRDEEMLIRLSPKDFEWFESNKTSFFKDLHLDPGTKIESDPLISPGGLIIETEFGIVDATIEQRIAKIEEVMKNQT